MDVNINWEAFGILSGTLFVFGIIYNCYIAQSEQRGDNEGATAIQVAWGTFVTLAGINIMRYFSFKLGLTINPSHAAETALMSFAVDLAMFTAAGTPMIIGYWNRYTARRRNTNQPQAQLELEKLLGTVDQEEDNNDETA